MNSPWDQLDIRLATFGSYIMFSMKKPYQQRTLFPAYVRLVYPFETLVGAIDRNAFSLKLNATSLPDIFYEIEKKLSFMLEQIYKYEHALLESANSSLPKEDKEFWNTAYENSKNIYRQDLKLYQQLQQIYPHTSAKDAILHDSYPPIPPDEYAVDLYLQGATPLEELSLRTWCVAGRMIQSLGNFHIYEILRLNSQAAISPNAYCLIALKTKTETIDIGIMGKEENTEEGIKQRLRICLSGWNTTLLNLQIKLTRRSASLNEESKNDVQNRFIVWQDRLLLFKENFNSLFARNNNE
jgi:hypothetical protein